MSNRAVRKIFCILIEKLARLEIAYENKLKIDDVANKKFISTCKDSLTEIKKELSEAFKLKDTEKTLAIYKNCMDKFLEMHTLLAHLPANVIPSETYIFLSDVLKTKKSFKELDSRILMLTQDFLTRNTHKFTANLPFASDLEKKPLALYMPVLQSSNPLYWPILVKNVFSNVESVRATAKKHFDEVIGYKTDIPEEKKKLAEKLSYSLMSDLFTLRLMGPAYYYLFSELGVFRSIAETKTRHFPTLAMREQLLFEELNRLNLSQKIEGTHNWFISLGELSDDLHTALGFKISLDDLKTDFDELVICFNKEIKKIFDQDKLFKTEDLNVSLTAQEKIKFGILITSINKVPNTPQQIINAGWIHHDAMAEEILNAILDSDTLDYRPFIEHIKNTDGILTSSIEKSRLIDILLDED